MGGPALCRAEAIDEGERWEERSMSCAGTTSGLGTGPGEGEAVWFNGGSLPSERPRTKPKGDKP